MAHARRDSMLPSTNQYGAVARPARSSWIVANRTATPLASALAHRHLTAAIVAIVSLIGLAAAIFYGRNYVAEATIRVSPVVPASLAGEESRFSSNSDYRDFVQQQVFEINNFGTVKAALDLLGPNRSLWQQPGETDRHAAERLMGALKVQPVADSYLVKVELGGGSPDGLDQIVNAVVKSYLSRTAKRELDGADVGFQLLTSRQAELQQSVGNDQQQYSSLIQELGVSSVSGELVNPYDKMLADSNAALAHARRSVLQAQAHLDAVKSHRQRTEAGRCRSQGRGCRCHRRRHDEREAAAHSAARGSISRAEWTGPEPSRPQGARSADRNHQQGTGEPRSVGARSRALDAERRRGSSDQRRYIGGSIEPRARRSRRRRGSKKNCRESRRPRRLSARRTARRSTSTNGSIASARICRTSRNG